MTELEKTTMYNMLKEVKRLASNASLTGALEKGAPILVATYNKCLAAMKTKGDITVEQLFPELLPNADIDEVGVAGQLSPAPAPQPGATPPRHRSLRRRSSQRRRRR